MNFLYNSKKKKEESNTNQNLCNASLKKQQPLFKIAIFIRIVLIRIIRIFFIRIIKGNFL